jgi:hypothetical protein
MMDVHIYHTVKVFRYHKTLLSFRIVYKYYYEVRSKCCVGLTAEFIIIR